MNNGNGAHSFNSATTTPLTTGQGAAPDSEQRIAPAMDFLPRRRDQTGNSAARQSAYSPPAFTGTPIEESDLAPGLRAIQAELPLAAAEIKDFHDRKLLPAFARHQSVIEHEHAVLEAQKETAQTINVAVDAERQRLETERENIVAPYLPALREFEDKLIPQAHDNAAGAVTTVGSVYLPDAPSEEAVLRHERRSRESVAAQLCLPWAEGDKGDFLASPMGTAATIGVGFLLGGSLGLAVHALTPYTLVTRWPVTLICAGLGYTIVYSIKRAVYMAWRHVGQDFYSRQPRRKWADSVKWATLRTAALLIVEVCTERQGLLATMQISHSIASLSGGSSDLSLGEQIASWVVPMVVSSGLLFWAADQGYLAGRHHEVLCRLTERQDEIWREEDSARRNDPDVQRALHAIAQVRDLIRRHGQFKARIAEAAAPLDARIAEVTARRVTVPEGLSTEAKHRIQDSRDDYLGAQAEFDQLWEQARREIEPTGSRWLHFTKSLFGSRHGGQRAL